MEVMCGVFFFAHFTCCSNYNNSMLMSFHMSHLLTLCSITLVAPNPNPNPNPTGLGQVAHANHFAFVKIWMHAKEVMAYVQANQILAYDPELDSGTTFWDWILRELYVKKNVIITSYSSSLFFCSFTSQCTVLSSLGRKFSCSLIMLLRAKQRTKRIRP